MLQVSGRADPRRRAKHRGDMRRIARQLLKKGGGDETGGRQGHENPQGWGCGAEEASR